MRTAMLLPAALRRLFVSLVLFAAGAAASSQPPPRAPARLFAERAAQITAGPFEKRVLALYYPWYGTPQVTGKWMHYERVDAARKFMGDHLHYPALGAYDSQDPKVAAAHLKQAREAGIDTLVCSWWGKDDPTDKAIRGLLAQAEANHVSIAVMWDVYRRGQGPAEIEETLVYLLQNLGKQPGFLKVGGKPVIFVYWEVYRSLRPDEWARVLANAARRCAPGAFAIADGQERSDLLVWDGSYSLPVVQPFVGATPEWAAEALETAFSVSGRLARLTGRLQVATVFPGHDDGRVPANAGHLDVVDRLNGAFYSALWTRAIQQAPDWILVNSFNQWHVGTEIEPSVELGDRYLTLTKQHAAEFKAGRAPAGR